MEMSSLKPPMLKVIALLMLFTIFRVQTILFIPQVEMFDGKAQMAGLVLGLVTS